MGRRNSFPSPGNEGGGKKRKMSEKSTSSMEEENGEKGGGATLFYLSPREALNEKDIRNLKDSIEESGEYSLIPSENGKNLRIQRNENSGNSLDMREIL